MRMKTISLQITDWQDKRLKSIKAKIGTPCNVLIRNAINLYLEKFADDNQETHIVYHSLGSDEL